MTGRTPRQRRAQRDAELTWRDPHPKPGPRIQIVSSADMGRCPTLRMDATHYRPDGTCMCLPPRDETLEPHLIRGEN